MAIFNLIVPFTKKWEAGLSRAKTDSASNNPAPYSWKDPKDGVIKTGWHTNKGVTWGTFKGSASKLGYEITANNFFLMPDAIWLKIAKLLYWDVLGLDNCKSDAVAIVMFSWQWGSGYAWRTRVQTYLKSKNIVWDKTTKQIANKLNLLIEKQGEQKTFTELIEQKRQYLVGLNQPANLKGWLNRLNDLSNFGNELIKKKINKVNKPAPYIKYIRPTYDPYTRKINL